VVGVLRVAMLESLECWKAWNVGISSE